MRVRVYISLCLAVGVGMGMHPTSAARLTCRSLPAQCMPAGPRPRSRSPTPRLEKVSQTAAARAVCELRVKRKIT